MREPEEKSGVPGTGAHRATLRQVIDEKDSIPRAITQELGLMDADEEQIHSIIQAEYSAPFLSMAGAIEAMEGLMESPDLGPGRVYEEIEEYRSIMLIHVAARCYAAGMKASQTRDNE